jgi:hypothetical protein
MADRGSSTRPRLEQILVMAGLVPGIHVLEAARDVVDGRDIGERKRRRPLDGYARP